MRGPADGWEDALSVWAQAQGDIRALVQIGSRVQPGAAVDAWSDYDYQLVTTAPERYRDGAFCRQLGPCWASGAQVAFGNSVKVTGIFAGAREADFVILHHREVVIALLALRWPRTARLWPRALRQGVANLRIVAAPGWRVIKGGARWERRYARIQPLRLPLTHREFNALCGEFWTQLVWAAKKAGRGEFVASQRGLHRHLVENALRVLQEEALLEGRPAYPLGRRAELWLGAEPARVLAAGSRPERASLLTALEGLAEVFSRSSQALAARQGWESPSTGELRAWLGRLAANPN
jgi:hypothetical protein